MESSWENEAHQEELEEALSFNNWHLTCQHVCYMLVGLINGLGTRLYSCGPQFFTHPVNAFLNCYMYVIEFGWEDSHSCKNLGDICPKGAYYSSLGMLPLNIMDSFLFTG